MLQCIKVVNINEIHWVESFKNNLHAALHNRKFIKKHETFKCYDIITTDWKFVCSGSDYFKSVSQRAMRSIKFHLTLFRVLKG